MGQRLSRVSTVFIIIATLLALSHASADVKLSKREAERMHQKVALINYHGERGTPRGVSTTVTETELNAYLRFHIRDQIPPGIIEPYIAIMGGGRVAGRAIVDLDAVREQQPRGWLDPAGYMTGQLPVRISGVLRTKDGVGRFDLEMADISGMTVPKFLLQELVSHYSKTPDHPNGIGIDDPFELPAGIKEIKVEKGEAVVLQ